MLKRGVMNKRGLSEIVTTVLIILLVIAAIIIIWFFARAFIFGTSSKVDSGLFTSNLEIKTESVYYNTTHGNISFVVERKAGYGNLAGVNVILDGESGDSCTIKVNGTIKELESKRIGPINYASCNIGNLTRVSVAPIILSKDSKELQGEVTDKYVIGRSSSGQPIVNPPVSCTDGDGDWYNSSGSGCGVVDCNDGNALIKPGALEICGNTIDEDCSGADLACPIGTGLIAYYSLDNQADVGNDDSGNGNDGTNNGATFVSCSQPGQGALSFDGINDFVSVPDGAYTSGMSSFSVGFWGYFPSVVSGKVIISKGDATLTKLFRIITITSNRVQLQIADGTNTFFLSSALEGINAGQWNHIVATYDGQTRNAIFYINGGVSTSAILGSEGFTPNIANTDPITIGALSTGGNAWNGSLDEVKIYNKVLSQAEVQALYNEEPCQVVVPPSAPTDYVAYWKFDEFSWSGVSGEVKDEKGINNGTAINGASITLSGKVNNAGNFDGVNDYINVPFNSLYNFEKNDSFSGSAWVKRDKVTVTSGIMGKWTGSGKYWYFQFDPSLNRINLVFGNTTINQVFAGTTAVSTGNWTHVAFTSNGTHVKIYRNGALESITAITLSNSIKNSVALQIGQIGSNLAGYYHNGSIDEVKIYNRTLNNAEIQQLYLLS